jgi:hypothetical protein
METDMKVGVLQFFGWRDRSVPLRQIYDMALERIAIMDTTGYGSRSIIFPVSPCALRST